MLKDVLLPDGAFFLRVSGPPDPDDPYVLRVDTTSAPAPGWEAEPNDGPALANALPAEWVIRGSGAAEDADVFAFAATGEPQLWRLDVEGAGITGAEWLRADGSTMGNAEVALDGSSARLLDMYLVPGQRQLVRVRASGGEYRLALEPLGPPDPNGEREPNDGLAFNKSLPWARRGPGGCPRRPIRTSTGSPRRRPTISRSTSRRPRMVTSCSGSSTMPHSGSTHLLAPRRDPRHRPAPADR